MGYYFVIMTHDATIEVRSVFFYRSGVVHSASPFIRGKQRSPQPQPYG